MSPLTRRTFFSVTTPADLPRSPVLALRAAIVQLWFSDAISR